MKNELSMLISKYMSTEFSVHCENKQVCEKSVCYVIESFETATPFDGPDIYAKKDDEVLLIEHFEFDSSNQNKGGSEYRRNKAGVDKALRDFSPPGGKGLFDRDIKCTHSTNDYITNFANIFNAHYGKIDAYIEKLQGIKVINDRSDVKVCFFIEDVTLMGNNYVDKTDGVIKPLVLLYCKQFIDIFEQSTKLDYIFFGNYDASEKCFNLNFISRNVIDDFLKKEIDLVNVEIIDLDLHVTGYQFEVPRGPNRLE